MQFTVNKKQELTITYNKVLRLDRETKSHTSYHLQCQFKDLNFSHIHNDQSHNCTDHSFCDRPFVVNGTQRIIADATMGEMAFSFLDLTNRKSADFQDII